MAPWTLPFWRSHRGHLLDKGYALSLRYDPSWDASTNPEPFDTFQEYHDQYWHPSVAAATRLHDGIEVVLKQVSSSGQELSNLLFLNEKRHADSRNHTIPILDYFIAPGEDDITIIVTPKFMPTFATPPYHCRGEILNSMRQIMEGIEYMHHLKITHGRIEKLSVVVDGAKFCPEGYHCAPFTFKLANKALFFRHRCQVMPVNYYFVDLEKSSSFSDSDIDVENIRVEREGLHPLSYMICPGEAQELNRPRPIDPFALDVYSTGRMLMKLVMPYEAMDYVRPLLSKMISSDPTERPTMANALSELQSLSDEGDLNAEIEYMGINSLHIRGGWMMYT